MPIGLERKLPIILFIVLLVMVGIGYISYSNTVELRSAVVAEKHTQDVLLTLDETVIAMINVETGMRGYFIQNQEEFLAPYANGKKVAPEKISKLRDLIGKNPEQKGRIDRLEALINERIADADAKVDARKALDFESALAKFTTSGGRLKMDEVRGAIEEIREAERNELRSREEALNKNVDRAIWILIGVGGIGILTLGLANIVVFAEVKKRRKAESDLKEVNRTLERRVEARTAELGEANKNLATSELFNRSVIDSLPAHIAVLDAEGNIVMVNDAWEKFAASNVDGGDQILGTGIGQNYLTVCGSDGTDSNLQNIARDLRAVLSGEVKTFTHEYPCHSPTEERWFLMQANAMHSSTGGLVISHYDITDRVTAEQAVRLSEEFNRSIVENSPDCVKVLSIEGAMLSMNYPGMCLMEIDAFGPFYGKDWTDNWKGDGNEKANAAVASAQGGETAAFEGFCETAKGNPKWWEVSVAPVMDENGDVNRLLVVSREITNRKIADEERESILRRERAARQEAEIANRLRDEFMATVSHELRTPLNSILGWARLLKGGMLDEQASVKAVDTIIKSSESQNRLIEDLLDVARMISGKLELDIAPVGAIDLISTSVEAVRPMAQSKDVMLSLKIDENSREQEISGDVNRLRQVMLNLLTNAIKFTKTGGGVEVSARTLNGSIEITVTDTGIGISKEFLPYVFERFRQDASNMERRSGLGLGLAIVRNLIELHGGSVSVESEGEEKGSTFAVKLPVVR